MCLGIPGKVLETYDQDGTKMGRVDFDGIVKEVCLAYVPEIEVEYGQPFTLYVIMTGPDEETVMKNREWVRYRVSFYASTPAYRPVMELHGWGDTRQQLSRLAAKRRWAEMPDLIKDEMLDEFALSGTWDELPGDE